MNLFGVNISKAKKPGGSPNRLLSSMLQWWMGGREWIKTGNDTALLNAYRSWIYVCVNRNSQFVARVPFKLMVAGKEKGKSYNIMTRSISNKEQDRLFKRLDKFPAVHKAIEFQEVMEHPLLDLLAKVNNFMNKTDLFEYQNMHQELTGNAWWYICRDGMGVPQEIWPINPSRMTIIPDREKFIKGYIYTNGATKIEFSPEEIIHFKFPNPNDLYYGTGPLAAAADMYNINQNMNTYENAMFTNNARPDGYFWTDQDDIDDNTFNRLSAELLETWAGVRNSGKTGLLTNGVKFEPVNFTPREMAFLKGREHTKKEIFEIFGNPEGLFDKGAIKANAEAAQYTYAKYTIDPRLRRTEEKLNERLTPMYDEKLFIVYDDVVLEDQEYQLREDVELRKIGARSTNEIRISRNEGPIEGGDSYEPLGGAPQFGNASQGVTTEDQKAVEDLIADITERISSNLVGGVK